MLNLQNLRPWEKVDLVIKRHWIVYVILWFYVFIWLSVTTTIFWFFGWDLWVYGFMIIFWMLFIVFLYVEWLNHELDMFIVTNNRIIGLDQVSFLNRTISECNLWQVQEVNAQTKWLLANLLDYGQVTIQTAWNVSNFDMTYVPQAIHTSRKILNAVDDYRDTNKVTDVTNNNS